MEVQELANLFYNNLDKVLTSNNYKSIINRGNNLIRYDIINRILIQIQNKDAFDLKSSDEWEIDGRQVKSGQKPIYVLMPNYVSKYVDAETGKELENNELSIGEINKALEYGIIKRTDTLKQVFTLPVFDIRQTVLLDDTKYIVNKPVLSSSMIIEIFQSITKCKYEFCEDTYYSKSDNILYISKQPYKELVTVMSEYITQYYISSDIYGIDNIPEENIDILKQSLTYSICSLLAVKKDIGLDGFERLDTDGKLDILKLLDVIMFDIVSKIQFTKASDIADASSNINMLRKAESLLNIMESVTINNKMKGK